MKTTFVTALFLYLVFYSIVFALGEAYTKKWPQQVKVLSPDPVLGDKPYWEHWTYSESFAKRFKGHNIKGASPELNKDVQAIVMRVSKVNLLAAAVSDYPKQYSCELEIYFNSNIVLPLLENQRLYKRTQITENALPSYTRLIARNGQEQPEINILSPSKYGVVLKYAIALFHVPIDGRLAEYRSQEYHHDFIKGLSVVISHGDSRCRLAAPVSDKGAHWISLFGNKPFGGEVYGFRKQLYKFKESKKDISLIAGLNKVPISFSKIILPKVALIKALNGCIYNEQIRARKDESNLPEKIIIARTEIKSRCDDIRINGILTDPWLRKNRNRPLNYSDY